MQMQTPWQLSLLKRIDVFGNIWLVGEKRFGFRLRSLWGPWSRPPCLIKTREPIWHTAHPPHTQPVRWRMDRLGAPSAPSPTPASASPAGGPWRPGAGSAGRTRRGRWPGRAEASQPSDMGFHPPTQFRAIRFFKKKLKRIKRMMLWKKCKLHVNSFGTSGFEHFMAGEENTSSPHPRKLFHFATVLLQHGACFLDDNFLPEQNKSVTCIME